MPNCSCKPNVLVETKPCESRKKCANFCKTECCPEEETVDCCTPAYLRLSKLTNTWSQLSYGSDFLPEVTEVTDAGSIIILNYNGRAIEDAYGNGILAPIESIFEDTDNGIGLVTTSISGGDVLTIGLDFAYNAYLFVNTSRYSVSQECGRKDQVIGWLVDISTENLEVFQPLPEFNLTTQVNRLTLLETAEAELTRIQKKQLLGLNLLYKLSLKAIAKSFVPRIEGNIVSITDKTGQSWTIAINSSSSFATINNTQFVLVAVPSC
jgi:hypothetical protein